MATQLKDIAKKWLRRAPVLVAMALAVGSCTIEPPLKLADSTGIDVQMPEVITDINVVWEISPEWRKNWWYGWDEADISLFGSLDYPMPTNYEVRFYYLGSQPSQPWLGIEAQTVYGNRFQRRFAYGYHDLLFWSNIDSPDGTQVLQIDESDANNILATTSRSRLSYNIPSGRGGEVYNSPEIFYSAMVNDFFVSHNPADYDYYDEERKVYVKCLNTELNPLVYTYLVQVVIYNNHNRIVGITDQASVSSLADGVSIHTGHTSSRDIIVSLPLRLKHNMAARNGREADIFGGRLTTFGLCDMDAWVRSRASRYHGGRSDLLNHVMLNFQFSNSSDSLYFYNVTPQMQAQAHGGVITIEIDADTIKIPNPAKSGAGAGFDATIAPKDSVNFDFNM